jgi:tocopherol cyclase
MSFIKKTKPSVFQGNLNKKRYFEGWYFKLVSEGGERIYSIIPGISLSDERYSFIQVIEGKSGKTDYTQFHLDDFRSARDKFEIRIGDNIFSQYKLNMNYSGENFDIRGEVAFEDSVPWKGSLLYPGIMGWYGWAPFMECYHGVVSLDHRLNGGLLINRENVDFTSGRGYIEKDWGKSFPECWVWAQANCFKEPGISFMFSVAKIPWLGRFFIGHVGFILYKGKIYKFATWNGSSLSIHKSNDNQLLVSLSGKEHLLEVTISSFVSGNLKAPVFGAMERYIKESVDATLTVRLSTLSGDEIYSGISANAGLEAVGDIFRYLNE